MNEQRQDIGLAYYLGVLRARWSLIVGMTVLGALVGVGLVAVLEESYTATTSVNVSVISTDPFSVAQSASGLLDPRTEAQIATSFVVVDDAIEQMDTDRTVHEVREDVDAVPVADTTIIEISYTASSPAAARAGTDAVATAYLSFRADQAEERLEGMIDRIDERVVLLREELVEVNARGEVEDPASGGTSQATSDRESITMEINSLITQRNRLESVDTAGGFALTPARENPLEVAPSQRTLLTSGVFGGLLMGVILAFAVHGLDRRLRSTSDIERRSQSKLLAELTATEGVVPAADSDLDELRIARERLMMDLGPLPLTVSVIDHTDHLGLSVDVPANLAFVLAQEDQSVDLVLPAVSSSVESGLVDGLELRTEGEEPGARSYRSALVPGLSVFVSDRTTSVLDADPIITATVRRHLRNPGRSGITLLSLPANASQSSRALAQRLSEGAVLVVARGSSRSDQLANGARELREAGVVVMGVLAVPRARAWSSTGAVGRRR